MQPLSIKATVSRAAAATVLALGLVTAGSPQAAAADNPFQRGPDPTNTSIEATSGPFAVTQATITNPRGFGGGIVYFPTSTAEGTFGAVAIAPGFTERWSVMSWLGPRLASFGFVVVGIETNSTLDQPNSRGTQLLAALDWAVSSSPAASRIDRDRLAVAGHSMGGGGTLAAANTRPTLQAAIPLAPWHTTKSWPGVQVPTLIIGGESDTVAPVAQHAEPFYTSIPGSTEKAYLELNNAGHNFTRSPNVPQARIMISWLKAFVDNDTRYLQFLCPGPARDNVVTEEYRNTCPLTV
ncbi:alpha/beta hydrolase family protein [Actinophytocola sp.]|uniref:alpha/beta hydrolase family protein n=1 Tax=Actinophytocola sp. TaxID=1872138 RepID=UPI0039C8973B